MDSAPRDSDFDVVWPSSFFRPRRPGRPRNLRPAAESKSSAIYAKEEKTRADTERDKALLNEKKASEQARAAASAASSALDAKAAEVKARLVAESKTAEALTLSRQAQKAELAARTSETNAKAAAQRATALRLAMEGQAIVSDARPGGTQRGLLQILAAHRLEPDIEPY